MKSKIKGLIVYVVEINRTISKKSKLKIKLRSAKIFVIEIWLLTTKCLPTSMLIYNFLYVQKSFCLNKMFL